MENKKAILIIMDGWGLGKVKSSDAIQHANVPFVTSLYAKYPNTTLITCGEAVGLPEGQMGNSEVGHLNLGAGRIVYQELQRINVAVRDGSFAKNEHLLASIRYAKENKKPLHLLGLVSDGGVHSHTSHLQAICDVCKAEGLSEVYIHAFTDGRDTDPKSGLGFITGLQQHLNNSVGKIATVSGRYYAMDRDKRWERVKLAYDALVKGEGQKATDAIAAVENAYAADITDEFIKPTIIVAEDQQPLATISEGDAVICFNFRTDRCREITQVLTQKDTPEYDMHTLPLHYVTMTRYDDTYHDVHVMFEKDDVSMTMGEVLEKAGKTQVRIAETEKYPHVTFFFSGGREEPFKGERRIMCPSPKVATYDLQPEMSAPDIRDAIMNDIRENEPDFICLNFANTDMVGHTGVFKAAMKAAETVDQCLSQIIPLALEHDYSCIIIADHGNSDYMINEDGTPNTAHTKNPVPCILVSKHLTGNEKLKNGRLADVAPTLLALMGMEKGKEMTGENLVS